MVRHILGQGMQTVSKIYPTGKNLDSTLPKRHGFRTNWKIKSELKPVSVDMAGYGWLSLATVGYQRTLLTTGQNLVSHGGVQGGVGVTQTAFLAQTGSQ